MRKFLYSRAGMSLVELLVAMAILAVALVPLLSIFLHALRTSEHSNKRTIALNLLRDMQEEVRSKAFTEPNPPALASGIYYPDGDPGVPMPTGLDANDNYDVADTNAVNRSRRAFDDVDDYDGWCRGQDCTCSAPQATDGRCLDDAPLEAYDGTKYVGNGYPHYQGFTRMVRVYNIFQNLSTVPQAGENRRGSEPPTHMMRIGRDETQKNKPFNFYDLRDASFPRLTTLNGRRANGLSRLKVIHVTVTYRGTATPPIRVEDTALAVMPLSKQLN